MDETPERSRTGAWRRLAIHSPNVRICHWINVIACGYLLLSGIHIFLDFPELYWGHTGYQGHPAIFKLSDWGLSWDEAGELGNRMWGRNYHFTFAWVFLINGLVYAGWNLARGHFARNLLPGRDELTVGHLRDEVREHLRWPRRAPESTVRYGTLQKLSYLLLIFVYVPLMALTGLAQSPGITAGAPWLLDMFGGRQTARSLHTFGTVLLVLFVIVHLLEVAAAGVVNRVRSMITGNLRVPEGEQ